MFLEDLFWTVAQLHLHCCLKEFLFSDGLMYSWHLEEYGFWKLLDPLIFTDCSVCFLLVPGKCRKLGKILGFIIWHWRAGEPTSPPPISIIRQFLWCNYFQHGQLQDNIRLAMDSVEQLQAVSSTPLRPQNLVSHHFSKRKGEMKRSGDSGWFWSELLGICIRKMYESFFTIISLGKLNVGCFFLFVYYFCSIKSFLTLKNL